MGGDTKWIKWVESALAVFVNLSYQAKDKAMQVGCSLIWDIFNETLSDLKIGELLVEKFILNESIRIDDSTYEQILCRSLQVLSKLNYAQEDRLLFCSQPLLLSLA